MEWFFFIFYVLVHFRDCNSLSDKEYALLPPIFENDNYDRCMLLEDESLYCFTHFDLKPTDPTNPSDTWKNIEILNGDFKNFRHNLLRHGICVPFTCPNMSKSYQDVGFKEELAACYSKKYEHLGVHGTVQKISCRTAGGHSMDLWDITVLCFFTLYIMLLIFASFYEGLARYQTSEEYQRKTGTSYGRFISCFSIIRNWFRLKKVDMTPQLEKLKGVQGIRFYNMFTVILSHASMYVTMGPVSNTLWVERTFDNPGSIFLSSGAFAVATFFLLSSWFLSYHIFKRFNGKTGRKLTIKIVLFTLLFRYIRITPLIAVTVTLLSSIMYFANDGPLWDLFVGRDREFCRENGWTNILYINTIINPDRMCFIETWYTAVDMHGFILCLIILYFTVENPKRLLWIVPSVAICTQGIFLKTLYEKKIYSVMAPTPENLYLYDALFQKDGVWFNTLASTSLNMMGSLVGLVGGYLYYKHENDQIFTNKIHTVLWWIFSFGMCISIILFPGMWIFSKNYYDSFWFSLPYFGLSTLIFSCGICIGIFGISRGVGWMARWVVEWEPIYVLGRLSYSTYIGHYFVVMFKIGTMKTLLYASNFQIMIYSIEFLAVSIMVGLILTLTIELPVSALLAVYMKEKLVENRKIQETVNTTGTKDESLRRKE